MLSEQIKNAGILRNLTSLYNFIQNDVNFFLEELPINYLEYSILTYISQNESTQYKIAEKYMVSFQRVSQIVNKLVKSGYIRKEEAICNGRIIKRLIISEKGEIILDDINNKLVKNFEEKNIQSEELIILNESLKRILKAIKR